MNEADAHEFYKDPQHLTPAGPGQRREAPMKTGTIPIRFTPEMIAAVKYFARLDAVTVSTWIRNLVDRELHRRQPSATAAGTFPTDMSLDYQTSSVRPQSATVPSPRPSLLCGR